MKKIILLKLSLLCSCIAFAQLDDTNSSNIGSMTLGTGTGTLYQFAGDQKGSDGTNQSQGGFGVLSGPHQISPIIWMYGSGGKNAFQVRKKGYNSTVQDGSTLLHVGVNGNIGMGTSTPNERLQISGNLLLNSFSRGSESGIFFREGFNSTTNNKYNLSILSYDDGDGSADALSINAYDGIYFNTGSNTRNTQMYINGYGNVGVGTIVTGTHKLAVEGSIGAREISVEVSGWSDFVFENSYKLPSLEEVEKHINDNGHLPEIPNETEVTENGINLGEMNAKLLQKIEELTLYLIEQNKENQDRRIRIERLESKITKLEN